MKSFVQFLTTPSSDTAGTALLLHFDDKRYIIGNIHEGTQRALIQRGTKLLKVSDIFLTGKTEWRTNGGLIGMILTLADAAKAAKDAAIVAKELKSSKLMDQPQKDHPQNEPKNNTTSNEAKSRRLERQTLTIHGGPNVTHTLATARRFVFRKGMPVDVNEIEETCGEQTSPTWADQNIKVWAMSINPSSSMRNSLSGETPSPGKRSFDEFQEKSVRNTVIDDERSISQTATTNEEDRNQQLRRGVVSDMFDSNWRLDALVEIPIALVNMPAALFVRNPNTHKIEKYIGPLPGGQDPLPDINVLVRRAWPGSLVTQLPPTKPSQTSLSYIIRNHHQRGKFLPSKAKALNVEEGEKYRKLTMGIPVMSTDGKIVHPEEVLEPGRPGRGFAVIELPSRDYVYELVNRPEWRASEIMEGVEAFIWILGSGVGEDQTLIEFMNRFKNQKHIISSQDYCPNMLSMDSAAAAAIRHHQIDPTRYPVPIHSNTSSFPTKDLDSPYLSTPNFSIASRGLTIKLEPSVVVQEENIEAPLNTAAVIKATSKDVLILAKAIQLEIASEENQKTIEEQNLPSPDAEIICLGTGSALPSKYRNVSATLLRVPGSGSYLLDCGENTLGQLRRIYSPEELVEVLRDLKMIWISHLHADHHLGTVSVIKAWYQAVYGKDYDPQAEPNLTLTEQPTDLFKKIKEQRCLFVASDLAMLNFLKEYASVEDYGYDKIVGLRVYGAKPEQPGTTSIQWNKMPVSFKDISPFSHDLSAALRTATGLTDLAAANVRHCHGSKAVSLTFPTGFKFSYSGDCRPSRSFTEIGKESTVLLHEATFDDELRGDALAKLHCTTSEAIGVGIAMAARRVLLTHFSQRYQKIPIMDGVEGEDITLEDETVDSDPIVGIDGNGANTDVKDSLSEMVESDATLAEILDTPDSSSPNKSKMRISRVINHSFKPKHDMKIGVAFDYMRVKVKDIALLECFTPVLLKLYDEETSGSGTAKGASDEKDANTNPDAGKEKKQKKIGNGRMGRVQMSEQEKLDVRSGKGLFGEKEKQRA